jgi:hypothetical protein
MQTVVKKSLKSKRKVMRRVIIIYLFICAAFDFNAQQTYAILPPESTVIDGNFSCAAAFPVCEKVYQDFHFEPIIENNCDPNNALYYVFNFAGPITDAVLLFLSGGSGVWEWYGPFANNDLSTCEQINNYNANMQSGVLGGTNQPPVLSATSTGIYILKLKSLPCTGNLEIQLNNVRLICEQNVLCTECVTSFSPTPGRYVVSAWVKEGNSSYSVTSYQNSSLLISFAGSTVTHTLTPSGGIIDGWQRIEQVIDVPVGATGINIELTTTAQEAFFDDIRFYPFDGSMMSYVYDPVSLRLMAELDERNYATLYEYDEEGKLIRVKKETEKGVMTIQENRDNIKKGQ